MQLYTEEDILSRSQKYIFQYFEVRDKHLIAFANEVNKPKKKAIKKKTGKKKNERINLTPTQVEKLKSLNLI